MNLEEISGNLIHNDRERALVQELLRRLAAEQRDCESVIRERDLRDDVIEKLCAASGHVCGHDFEWTSHYGFTEAIADVESKIDALREDKARIDWLEANSADCYEVHGQWHIYADKGQAAPGIRAAIDAAKK